jgi:murein DD-endopeptidase MepM/ murein hydrolase activator NlpD
MQRKTSCTVVLILIIVAVVVYVRFGNPQDGTTPPTDDNSFDNGERYDSTNLNYMGVIYTNQSDILNWNGGYSESTNCPWGAIHNGLDFAFANGSTVIAAAPGLVEEIHSTDTGPADNIYAIHVSIRFNDSIQVNYVFEPWTTNSSDVNRVISMLEIEIGDWVAKGDVIGRFLAIGGAAHIHFGVYKDDAVCPKQFFSEEAYLEMMSLVHTYHPDWELCYP